MDFFFVFEGECSKSFPHGEGFEAGLSNGGFDFFWLGRCGEVQIGMGFFHDDISHRSTDQVEFDAEEVLEMEDYFLDVFHKGKVLEI